MSKKIHGKYPDIWIAVVDKEVKASGPDVNQIKQVVKDKLEEAAIMRIPKDEPVRPI